MEQRFVFDEAATGYHKARPGYPDALVDDVLFYADLKPNDRILEIGCGTGQATKSFAERGFPILAMDPGSEMLRVARESLVDFSNVEFLETTFEAWPVEPSSVPADHRSPVLALGVAGGAVSQRLPRRFRGRVRSLFLDMFPWVYRPHCWLASGKFISGGSTHGDRRRRAGICPVALSKDGLSSQVCSVPSSTGATAGSSRTGRQVT